MTKPKDSRIRQAFWLLMMAITRRGPFWLYLWCVGKASAATYWGTPL